MSLVMTVCTSDIGRHHMIVRPAHLELIDLGVMTCP